MDKETLIRSAAEKPAPAPKPKEEPKREDDKPTECGLTRKELRAIVEEIIG
jgi:hypothetical protein